MSIWLLLIIVAFVRLNESRYRLVMRLQVHRHIPVTRVIDRNGVTRIFPDGKAFCPCRRELTSPLPSDVEGGQKKFSFLPDFLNERAPKRF